MTRARWWTAFAALCLGLCCHGAALAADVPVGVQLPLFANIWKMDRSFKPSTPIVLAVLYQQNNVRSATALAEVAKWAQKNSAIQVVSVTMEDPNWAALLQAVEADVFYVTAMRGVDIAKIAEIARARRIRTMADVPEYVKQGLSVAIGVRNDRPLIIINLEAARAEGAAYQAQLLKLAEIVKR
jgi:hypothetical protein